MGMTIAKAIEIILEASIAFIAGNDISELMATNNHSENNTPCTIKQSTHHCLATFAW